VKNPITFAINKLINSTKIFKLSYMKKLMLFALLAISLAAGAQTNRVNDAAIYLRNGEIEDAKKAAEEAIEHPDTKADVKAWYYYVSILDTIIKNPTAYSKLADNVNEKFYGACMNCVKFDAKNKYGYYCKEQALINSAFLSFNSGIAAYEAKDYAKAIAYYQMVLDVIPFDKNEDLKKNNLSEKNIYLYMAYSAVQSKNNEKAKIYLGKLIEMNYDDHLIFSQMVNIHLEEGDTTKALTVLDDARKRYPSEKDLINQELNIYLAAGKQEVLIDKITAALELNPDDATLLYVRGNIYDNFSNDFNKRFRAQRDSVSIWKRKANTEKVLAKKTIFITNAGNCQKRADALLVTSKEYAAKAEIDYKKVVELNPEYIDAFFNLGALTNNKSTEIAEKINNLPNNISQAEYDKRLAPLKKEQIVILNQALSYFNQALSIAEAKPEDTDAAKKEKRAYLIDILYSIQQVYANLGDEKKTMEVMNRRKELE
jgi:Tfp pilus assembly protein PilF